MAVSFPRRSRNGNPAQVGVRTRAARGLAADRISTVAGAGFRRIPISTIDGPKFVSVQLRHHDDADGEPETAPCRCAGHLRGRRGTTEGQGWPPGTVAKPLW